MRHYILLLYLFTLLPLATCAQDVRRTKSGIIIIGGADTLRAVEPFRGTTERAADYASAVNRYKRTFGNRVNVYCMVIPTAIGIYCPEEAKAWTNDQHAVVQHLYDQLLDSVRVVNLFGTLATHAGEDIYSRTDHHWAPLGAYYAAQEFAKIAGVSFPDLSAYEQRVIHDYVGTMYRFSRDAAVKNAPEDFVYYVPRDSSYTSTSIHYVLGKNRQVTAEKEPEENRFFYDYADGSSAAYMTFMHGDTNTTVVKTAASGGRRLLILKDSYGNALPPFLFASFEEIHVVDCRYFLRNIVRYATEHGITDILFANNAGHACSAATHKAYHRYLEQ